MSKAIKQTLAALSSNQAVVIGREPLAKTPKGAVALQFGKSHALQRENTTPVNSLPPKLSEANKVLVSTGGEVTAKVAKAAGLDFEALATKLSGNKNLVVTRSGKNKFTVTVRAKRADLIQVGEAPAAKPSKGKTAPAKPAPKSKGKVDTKKAEPAKKRGRPAKAEKATPAAKKGGKTPAKQPAKASKKAPAKPAKATKKPEPAKKRGRPAKDTKPAAKTKPVKVETKKATKKPTAKKSKI